MKLSIAVLFLVSAASAVPLARQEGEGANRLDQPLSDPELRRTLLRVFAESLKAAAEGTVASGTARSSVNVPNEEIIDLTPPADAAFASDGFSSEQQQPQEQQQQQQQQQQDEVLLLSGDSPRGRGSSGISFTTTTEAPVVQNQDEPLSFNLGGELLQGDSTNHQFGTSVRSSDSDNSQAITESSPAQPPAEPTFPGPSPAPPSPTPIAVTVDETASDTKLSPADSEDVQRFVSAVKTSDESLGEGVELFQAPLIAAFALQQDGLTGQTRSLHAFPVNKAHEELLKQERQILSVAGQVVGTQRTGIIPRQQFNQPQQDFGRTVFDIQRSVQPNFVQRQQAFRNFETSQNQLLSNEVEPQSQLDLLVRRQQELQQQIYSLQRERSALLLQRNTRSEPIQSVDINSGAFSTGIPIYLQPPFF